MSYQVLARKWRPQNFKQMVGQEHVLQALIHALDSQRLHHAYLFTGTRGVGKTTIGRILAKCLSCQEKITSEPCGQCSACTAITDGRYVDLIEIDAASRTKVEDMRELLENVQYAPAQGRFKIYLIDEVHMLSSSSFNALLKTLEEPPAHVKFLFATTDPQKLPVTILSRCLQFNLKNMSPEKIVAHLKHVLSEERVAFEDSALWALARAAEGSMRDALSLTDQAIAYGNHQLTETGVTTMLGTVDQKKVYRILEALVTKDAGRMLSEVQSLADFSPDYRSVLATLSSILHRIALEQVVPGSIDNAMGDRDQISHYAQTLCAEDVQLFYQIALTSRQDLQITPDAKSGFEMALLRMLAFQMTPVVASERTVLPSQTPSLPGQEEHDDSGRSCSSSETDSCKDSASATMLQNTEVVENERRSDYLENNQSTEVFSRPSAEPESHCETLNRHSEPVDRHSEHDEESEQKHAELFVTDDKLLELQAEVSHSDAVKELFTPHVDRENTEKKKPSFSTGLTTNHSFDPAAWNEQAGQLGLTGMTLNFMLNSVPVFDDNGLISVFVESGHFRLLNENHEKRIREALLAFFKEANDVQFKEGLLQDQESPMMWRERFLQEKKAHAINLIKSDPHVAFMIETFGANLIEASIQPES
jgi:DNA polymerase-3 subunit gamma/tau